MYFVHIYSVDAFYATNIWIEDNTTEESTSMYESTGECKVKVQVNANSTS